MIKYVKVKKMIHCGENPGEKFLARLYRNQDVTLEQIAKEISDATTISEADTLACLKALEINIAKYILQGQAVKLEYLGSFIPAISAKAQESADKVDANTIKRFFCRFYPSAKFKKQLSANAKFQHTDLEVKGLIE